MGTRINRREFVKRTALAAGTAAFSPLIDSAAFAQAGEPATPAPAEKTKLRIAVIGCGGRGTGALVPPAARENLVAVIDPDSKNIAKALKKAKEEPGLDPTKIKAYADYRKFFDEMHKEVDAVMIATPNHHHALPALLAMQRGIAVYVEKPMAYDIDEARTMQEFARKYKVASQMGNQGHSGEGYRRLCEYIWAGAIGNVTEVYHWTNRANGGVGARPATLPVPTGLDWDLWVGPAPYRDFHKDLHPHEWHNWFDFGNGSLGNMACHIMDGAYWALKLDQPTVVEVEEITGGGPELYPVGTRIRWDFAARGDMPPVKVYWYDGKRKDAASAGKGDSEDSVSTMAANKPAIMVEMEKLTGRKFTDGATFYVGDKGVMYTGTYGNGVRILPEEKMQAFPVPPAKLPRVKGGHFGDFFRAVRGGEPSSAHFDYAAPFTEMVLLGDLAIMAATKHGLGAKIEWDGQKRMVKNLSDMNAYLKREPRAGWGI